MKRPSLLALAILILTLALVACERPAPTGDVPTPAPSDAPVEVIPAVTPDTTTPIEPAPETETADPTEPAVSNEEVTTEEGETNTESPTETENPTEETAVTEEPTEVAPPLEDGVYVVKSGDTLGQIAFIFDISVEDIMAANGLTNPDVLDVGDELIIPDAGFAETNPDAGDDDGGATTTERIHVVQAGDNLFRIGQFYGFTVDELAEYNDITDINSLDVGQEIKIPPSNQ
jgi:LysM repeat protein